MQRWAMQTQVPVLYEINSLLLDGIRTLVHLLPGKLSYFNLSRGVTQLFFFFFHFFFFLLSQLVSMEGDIILYSIGCFFPR